MPEPSATTFFTDIVTGEEMVMLRAARYDAIRDRLIVAEHALDEKDAEIARLRRALRRIAHPQAWKRGDLLPHEVARAALNGDPDA